MGLEEEHGWVVRMIQAEGFEDASSARPGKKGKDKSRGRIIGRRVGYLSMPSGS